MWTYYSIGDATFLVQVLNAVALVTQTGDFIAMARSELIHLVKNGVNQLRG